MKKSDWLFVIILTVALCSSTIMMDFNMDLHNAGLQHSDVITSSLENTVTSEQQDENKLQAICSQYRVSDFDKWQNQIQSLYNMIEINMNEENYGGISWVEHISNGIHIKIGVEIYVLENDEVNRIVDQFFAEYNKNIGEISVKYTLTHYSLEDLYKIADEIQLQPFFIENKNRLHGDSSASEKTNAGIQISVGVCDGKVNLYTEGEFPELDEFLNTYEFADAVNTKGKMKYKSPQNA